MRVIEARKLLKKLSPYEEVIIIFQGPRLLTSGEIEKLGISRQLLRYHVKKGHVKVEPYGKQK